MLNPSYTELIEKLNSMQAVDNQITSRYTIVIAAAKRARQLADGAVPTVSIGVDKSVSIAVKELDEGRIVVKQRLNEEVEVKASVHEIAPDSIGLWGDFD